MATDRFKYFRIEAREILDGLARGVLELERRADAELIARLLRLAHTLKGAARIVGHHELSELAHRMEDVVAPLRDAPAPQRLDAALAVLDEMGGHVAALQQAPAAAPATVRADGSAASPAPAPPAEPPIPRAEPGAIDDVLAGLSEIQALVRRLRGASDRGVLEQRIDQLERELGVVRQDAERLRLAAAGTSFTPLERTARDVAHALGKQVRFTSSGGDVRVDAHVLATLHGALVQLVRNAVAHGIEAPEHRIATGKPPEGQVALAVALDGSRVALTCKDDGRGIDLEAVRRAAIRRGLAADRARALGPEQLVELVLRGGLTTSAEVTLFAGRGIGLDVVHEAARSLGGELTAQTSPAGTTIRITAPITVAAVSVLVVGAGDRIAALPLAAVRRVARSAALAILRGPDGERIALDDLTVPFAPLARLLGAGGGGERSVVIVESAGELAAVGVHHVRGIDDAAMRALPAGAPIDPLVWGLALDADGVPRPILEPAALVAAVRALPASQAAQVAPPRPILIVDDSLTTRMLEQSILESAGYEVELASSAEEALAKALRRRYGLFLVDVEMPGMDGFALLSELRAAPELAEVPAIFVTSRNRPEDRERAAAVHAHGYVVKSEFDQTTLLAMIRQLVQR